MDFVAAECAADPPNDLLVWGELLLALGIVVGGLGALVGRLVLVELGAESLLVQQLLDFHAVLVPPQIAVFPFPKVVVIESLSVGGNIQDRVVGRGMISRIRLGLSLVASLERTRLPSCQLRVS